MIVDANATNWSGRSLRCHRCELVDETTIGGLCAECRAELEKCHACGAEGVPTKAFRLADADQVGLYGESRFCAKCEKTRSAGYVEAIC